MKLAYKEIHDKHEQVVGHYYRNFYRILKYVKASGDIPDEKKKDYTGILRAQLSSDELFVMYYSSLYIEGEKLRPFLEEYSMFDNLRPRKLIKISMQMKISTRERRGDVVPVKFSVDWINSTLLHPKNGPNPRRELYVSWKTERRAGRRKAAPFAKDRPQGRGGRPGRRPGARYGRHGCRRRPARVDETSPFKVLIDTHTRT